MLEIISPPKAPPDVAVRPKTATCTNSGLCYVVLREGAPGSRRPTQSDSVTVHYSGWTKDGKLFDSSLMRDRSATFPLAGVMRGWTEGVSLMPVGAIYRFWVPSELAYGDGPGRRGAPSGQLTFEIELLGIK